MSVTSAPLVFPHLLADRQQRLAALLWSTPDPCAAYWGDWLAQPEYLALAQSVPCLWQAHDIATWSPTTLAAWQQSAAPPLTPADWVEAADQWPAPLPTPVQWVAGGWYLQPPLKPSTAQVTSRARALQLLQMVADEADTHELEEVFRRDATLSFQLLRLVNSPAVGSRREITSFGQAILMLGRQPLRRWLNLLLFAARDDDARSNMLMAHVTLRARGMELLAQAVGLDKTAQDQAFMAGMFSMLGVLFGQPLREVLRPVKLTQELESALFEHSGEIGHLLQTWQATEAADVERVQALLAHWGLPTHTFNQTVLQACGWMLNLTRGGMHHG